MFDILQEIYNKGCGEEKEDLIKKLDNSFEKPKNLWDYFYSQTKVFNNKYNISNTIYFYLKNFSRRLLKKMRLHSEKFRIDMKEIITCVRKIIYFIYLP